MEGLRLIPWESLWIDAGFEGNCQGFNQQLSSEEYFSKEFKAWRFQSFNYQRNLLLTFIRTCQRINDQWFSEIVSQPKNEALTQVFSLENNLDNSRRKPQAWKHYSTQKKRHSWFNWRKICKKSIILFIILLSTAWNPKRKSSILKKKSKISKMNQLLIISRI